MAQRASRSRGARARRRFGLTAAKGACCVLVALCAAAGAAGLANSSGGFSVETGGATGSAVGSAAPTGRDEVEGGRGAGATCVVHVDGAVVSPGVYDLTGDDLRLEDAVEAAGGLSDDADTTSLNLAAPLEDGVKVHVPAQGEAASSETSAGSAGETPSSTLVNINTATAEELTALPGVGEATAANIIADREQNGPFTSIEDLMRVSGIGEKKFEKMRELICV